VLEVAPGTLREPPRRVVEQRIERNLQHSIQLALVVDEGWDRVGKVGHERHDREVRNGAVDRIAGAQRHEAADRDADLLSHLALSRRPCRLALAHAPAGQSDLPRMVTLVSTPAYERDHPAALGAVQDEYDRGLAGTPPEVAPTVHRMEQLFEAAEEVSQRRPLVNPPGAGKLGKVAEALQEQ